MLSEWLCWMAFEKSSSNQSVFLYSAWRRYSLSASSVLAKAQVWVFSS